MFRTDEYVNFKMYSRNAKTTNKPTASINKLDWEKSSRVKKNIVGITWIVIVRNPGPVNNIIYVNLFIIYSDDINPEPAYNIIYVNVIIIYNDVRNPGPVNNIIYVNVIIIYSDVPRADTQTDNFPTCTLQREKGVISFQVEKILLLFSI